VIRLTSYIHIFGTGRTEAGMEDGTEAATDRSWARRTRQKHNAL